MLKLMTMTFYHVNRIWAIKPKDIERLESSLSKRRKALFGVCDGKIKLYILIRLEK
jgi:hypothetical protein